MGAGKSRHSHHPLKIGYIYMYMYIYIYVCIHKYNYIYIYQSVFVQVAWHTEWQTRHTETLVSLPPDALPQSCKHGEMNYTVTLSGAKIQVQFVPRAFYITKAAAGVLVDGSRTFSWSTYGGVQFAWQATKIAAGVLLESGLPID